ncbi:MAG: hypothetical protein WCA07_00070 [Gloeobacterales cyanobacterium]
MSIFDKAKELAQQAAQGLSQADELLDNVKGFVPEDKMEQIKGALDKAEGAVGSLTGQPVASSAADQAAATEASDNEEQA